MPAIPRQVKVVKSVFTPRRKHDSIPHFHGEEELENDGNSERLSIPTLPTKGKLGRNAVNIACLSLPDNIQDVQVQFFGTCSNSMHTIGRLLHQVHN
jgi:hypothetical protein